MSRRREPNIVPNRSRMMMCDCVIQIKTSVQLFNQRVFVISDWGLASVLPLAFVPAFYPEAHSSVVRLELMQTPDGVLFVAASRERERTESREAKELFLPGGGVGGAARARDVFLLRSTKQRCVSDHRMSVRRTVT